MRETITTILQVYLACMCVLELCFTVTFMVFKKDIERRNEDDVDNAYWNRLSYVIATTPNKKLYALLTYIDVNLLTEEDFYEAINKMSENRQIIDYLIGILAYSIFSIAIRNLVVILSWIFVYKKDITRVVYEEYIEHHVNK